MHYTLGENMVKEAKGVKVFFQGLHMTHVIFVLVYNFKFCILNIQINIAYWFYIIIYAFIPSII
jgi:hypothetical protein